jgi:tetratricopeptide (TPR) repeat protein
MEEAGELLKSGISHLKRGDMLEALACVEKSFSVQETPRTCSYLGLLIARERGKLREGLAMCREALEEEPENPEFHLNLGRALYLAGKKPEAIAIVRKGLLCGENDDAVAWLSQVGVRRRPVFSFLPRNHWLNKYAGILMSRLGFQQLS